MNNQDIFKLMQHQHEQTVELLNMTKTAINAEVMASANMLELKIGEVIRRQDITNGRLHDVESECDINDKFRITLKYKLIGAIALAVIITMIILEFGLFEAIGLLH